MRRGRRLSTSQIVHILRKDVRHLRFEIVTVVAAAVVYVILEGRLAGSFQRPVPLWHVLVLAAGAYLASRVVHDDAIPGDTQFWLTRPYRWSSLLVAKLAFIALFVNLPLAVAQLVVFGMEGFRVGPHAGSLLWSFVLTFAALSLPVAALAALTRGTVQFVLTGVVIAAVAGTVPGRYESWPLFLEWFRTALAAALVIAIASWTLLAQYGTRNTRSNTLAAASAGTLAILVLIFFPLDWALALQFRPSPDGIEPAAFRVVLDPDIEPRFQASMGANRVRVDIPLGMADVPEGASARWNWTSLQLTGPDGRTWESADGYLSRHIDGHVHAIPLPGDVHEAWRNGPVRVRGSAYLTVFGNLAEETFTLSPEPVEVSRGMQCFAVGQGFLTGFGCRRPFGPPAGQVRYDSPPYTFDSAEGGSTTPFPSTIYTNFVWRGGSYARPDQIDRDRFDPRLYFPPGTEVTLTHRDEIAHVRRDFEFTIDLDDGVRP